MKDDVVDVLNRIKCRVDDSELRANCGFIPLGCTMQEIFSGATNEWETAPTNPINLKIMRDRLNQAKDLGLVMNESGRDKWADSENWWLTPTGEAYLGQRKRGKKNDFEFLEEATNPKSEREIREEIKKEIIEEVREEVREEIRAEMKEMKKTVNEIQPRQQPFRLNRPYTYKPPNNAAKPFESMPDAEEKADLPSEEIQKEE